MANEFDDTQDDNTQQQDNIQQQDTTRDDAGSAWLDKTLGEIDGTPRTPAAGKSEEGAPKGNENGDKARAALVDDGKGKGNNAQPRGQSNGEDRQVQPPTPPTNRKWGNYSADARGNIVDARGTIFAKQGGERGMFHKLYPHISRVEEENGALKSRLENFENATKLAKDAGLTLDEQGSGLAFMVSWKKDPKEAIKTLLNIASQRGIDTNDIVQGGGGFNQAAVMEAIEGLLEKRLSAFMPLVENFQSQREHQQLVDEVSTQYAAFLEEFPDAKTHEETIANVMRDKGVNEREAYFILRAFAGENRLDWRQPLAPQIQARTSNNDGERRPSGGGNNRTQLPNMGGRGANDVDVPANKRGYASADDSWDSIAREVLLENGRSV